VTPKAAMVVESDHTISKQNGGGFITNLPEYQRDRPPLS